MRTVCKLVALMLALAALAACTDNDIAIFYFIENEEKQVDFSLPNETTILGMGRVTVGADDYYFAALGPTVWRKDASVASADWKKTNRPPGSYALAMIDFNGDLYAGGIEGLYTWSSAAVNPTWVRVSDADLNGDQVVALFVANNRLFAVTFDGDFSLYSSTTGGDNSFDSSGLIGRDEPISQVIYADDHTLYYAVNGSALFSGAGPLVNTSETLPSGLGGEQLWGVVYETTNYNRLYIASRDGDVFSANDATLGWELSGNADESDVWFKNMATVDGNVIVGTHEHGYYEMRNGNPGSLSRVDDFNANELYNGSVSGFYVDGSDVFALTAGSGLWRATYSGTDWSDWVHE